MGLDVVELIMEVEEHFDLRLDETEQVRIVSVGDLLAAIQERLPLHQEPTPCPTLRPFWALHRELSAEFKLPRHDLRPATYLEPLLPPPAERRQWWRELAKRSKLRLPALLPPKWMRHGEWTIYLPLALAAIPTFVLIAASRSLEAGITFVFFGIGFLMIWMAITNWFSRHLQPDCLTLGGLTKEVLALNRHRFLPVRYWTPSTVWFDLREIISTQLGVPLHEVTPEKEFIRDFRAD